MGNPQKPRILIATNNEDYTVSSFPSAILVLAHVFSSSLSSLQVSTDLDRYIRAYEFVADVLSAWEL